jgi:hypothetical protein
MAGSLGLTEVKFFEKLINMFPQELDFNKIRSPSEYLGFRNSLASKYLNNLDVESLRKVSVALLNGQTTEVVERIAPVDTNLTTRQKKNRRSRVNKSSKVRAVAPLRKRRERTNTPWFDASKQEPPPKKPRIGLPFIPTTPQRSWVQYMPIVKFRTWSFGLREFSSTQANPLTPGSFATRSVKEEEYRHDIGAHTKEDECHICDQVYRYHFFDDYHKVTSRLIAFVAMHHWLDKGKSINTFNWCTQTWHENMMVDGNWVPASEVGELIDAYIKSDKFMEHNEHRTYSSDGLEWTSVEKRPPNPLYCFRLTR